MRTQDFDFDLPPELIAQYPAKPRDSARLLHVTANTLCDRLVRDLPDMLRHGDMMVVNDTRVIPAQLTANRGHARIRITLDRPNSEGDWHALARNARRLNVGDELRFDGGSRLTAIVMRGNINGAVVLRFNVTGDDFMHALYNIGALALPPYISRSQGVVPQDAEDYQTVFGANPGAVAAPTAGLHFTPELLERLNQRGVGKVTVTLHVGAGTFLPIRTDEVGKHTMHSERGEISAEAATAINQCRQCGGRILSVGTTTLRLLETAIQPDGSIQPFSGETSIFITPGAELRSSDFLLTNFHLPESTLFMLVCAFSGIDRIKSAYAHSIASRYRFYSYGDATLLERA